MTYDLLEKELKSGKLHSIYLFYGDEKYLIENLINKIKKNFGEMIQGINYIIIDENTTSDLIYNIESPAFGYDKKLILVKDSGLFKQDGRKKIGNSLQEEIATYINENIDIIDENVNLIFYETEVNKNSVFKAVDKNGIVCEINELTQYQLIQNLKNLCNAYKVNVSDSVLAYFIEVSGTNLQYLINEIRKLIQHAGEGGTISKTDVDNLAVKKIDSVIFDLTDSLGSKKTLISLQILDELLYQKEPLQKILIMLYNHFKKLYLCKIAVKLNKDVAASLELKPNQTFLVKKYKKQASFFTEEELKDILNQLIDLDYNSKQGKIDLDVGIRSILCSCF